MYRFVPMIPAEEISLPKDRRCLRFKCDSFYELNAVNTLPVHDLSAVNDCILRFKYSLTTAQDGAQTSGPPGTTSGSAKGRTAPSGTYKSSSTTYKRREEFSHGLSRF